MNKTFELDMKKTYEAPTVKVTVFNANVDILVNSDALVDFSELWG